MPASAVKSAVFFRNAGDGVPYLSRIFFGVIRNAGLMAKISPFRVGRGLAPAEKSHHFHDGFG